MIKSPSVAEVLDEFKEALLAVIIEIREGSENDIKKQD